MLSNATCTATARWVSEEELENGDEQITMEEDMAARGVPEAQRHIGYRRLVGRGVDRDEAGALQDFEVGLYKLNAVGP